MTNQNLSEGCFLPFAQAIVTGSLFALLANFSAAITILDLTEGQYVFLISGLAFALASLIAWLLGLSAWRKAAYQTNFYDYEPAEEEREEPAKVRVEVVKENGRNLEFIDLPCSLSQLNALATGILGGQTLSEAAWTGSNGLFTRSEFSTLRAELIKRGLAEWNNPRTPARGIKLTRGGWAAIRTFANLAVAEKGENNKALPEKQV